MRHLTVIVAALALLACDDKDGGPTEFGCPPEEEVDACEHETGGRVPLEECGFCEDPVRRFETDPRDPMGRPYYRTCAAYEVVAACGEH